MTTEVFSRATLLEANDPKTAPERLVMLATLEYEGEIATDPVRMRRHIRRAAILNRSLPLGCLWRLLSEGSTYAWWNPHVSTLMRDNPGAPWKDWAYGAMWWVICVSRMRRPPLSHHTLEQATLWAADQTMTGKQSVEADRVGRRIAQLFHLSWPEAPARS